MSVPNPATTDWVPLYGGTIGLNYEGDYSAATTYTDGDVVVKDGVAYLCVGGPTTEAPNPLPWGSQVGLGTLGELAYAESTTPFSATASTEATAGTVIALPPINCDGATPILVEFTAPFARATGNNGGVGIFLFQNGTTLGEIAQNYGTAAGLIDAPVFGRRRLTPSAGSHTFEIRASKFGTDTPVIYGGTGGPGGHLPMTMRASLAAPILIPSAGALTPVTYGTSLPVGPVDGQEAILVDNVGNPSYTWRFRYNASSSSPYKWEFIGGSPRSHELNAVTTTTSSAGAEGVPRGPAVILPRAGDYLIQYGSDAYADVADRSLLTYLSTTTAGLGFDYAIAAASVTGAASSETNSRTATLLAQPAGIEIRQIYAINAGTGSFRNRYLRALPIRVS